MGYYVFLIVAGQVLLNQGNGDFPSTDIINKFAPLS